MANYGHAGGLPSNAEWSRIRPTFERRYIEEHATLAKVMKELRDQYDFYATEQMYKRRIREWGLGKNLKQNEVEHVLGITALRRAQGKDTHFLLRGRALDMRSVSTYQRRQKLRTSDAIAAYMTGQSRECRGLRAVTPEHLINSASWATPDRGYEDALRAFAALFHGLVDTQYYWIEQSEIVMPPSSLRGEVSDVCSSLVASKAAGSLNMTTIRKLALLLESIVHSRDAWIHCRLVYTLWTISTAGHAVITKMLLAHLNALAATYLEQNTAQRCFVTHYSNLETDSAMKLAADMISLKAQMVGSLRIGNDPVAFKLRSLDYDVFWRQREQGKIGTSARSLDLFHRCRSILGPLAVETLTVLRTMLQDGIVEDVEASDFSEPVDFLKDSSKLAFCESPPAFTFDEHALGMEAASELACVYCQLDLHDAEAWILSRLLVYQKQTASGLRREYSLLVHVDSCAVLSRSEQGLIWLRRKQEIENLWQAQVETEVIDSYRST